MSYNSGFTNTGRKEVWAVAGMAQARIKAAAMAVKKLVFVLIFDLLFFALHLQLSDRLTLN